MYTTVVFSCNLSTYVFPIPVLSVLAVFTIGVSVEISNSPPLSFELSKKPILSITNGTPGSTLISIFTEFIVLDITVNTSVDNEFANIILSSWSYSSSNFRSFNFT